MKKATRLPGNDAKKKAKVLILTERFFPEEFLVNDLAAELKTGGMDIEVLTQVPSYPHDKVFDNYRNVLFQSGCEFHNIKIHRVKTYCGYNRSVFIKIFNYLNFAFLTSLWCLFRGCRYKQVFIYHTGPLTMATASVIMRFLWRRRCVIWTQDLWPDSVYAYGFKPTWWKRLLLNSFIRIIYSSCTGIAVTSPGFIEKLRPYTDKGIEFLPQWNQINFDLDRDSFDLDEGVKDFRIFTFAGNLGTAQNLDVLVEAFGELKLSNCVLRLVGGGVMLEPLKKLVEEKGYENIQFTGRLPQNKMPEEFAASDVMIISLNDKFSMTIPAKLQAYIAAGKPIFGVIGGDTAKIIRETGIGVVSECDKESIKSWFSFLAECSADEIAGWAKNAVKLSEEKFNRSKLIDRIRNLIVGSQKVAG